LETAALEGQGDGKCKTISIAFAEHLLLRILKLLYQFLILKLMQSFIPQINLKAKEPFPWAWYLVCNYIVNIHEGLCDPKSEIWSQGISNTKSVDKSLKATFLANMEMKVGLVVGDALQLVTK
jgi:hypothetical protein